MATGKAKDKTEEECLWAAIILKVMHTILHTDKDLRHGYFQTIQTQIFDRFYKHITRMQDDKLYLGKEGVDAIELVDFETKSVKSRDSVIVKLLHKAENVAEELFDRVGLRFVTRTKLDSIRVIKFLQENHVIVAHNIKPSRSRNTLFDIEKFKLEHKKLIRNSLRNKLSEKDFVGALDKKVVESSYLGSFDKDNLHSHPEYRSVQFTCRQLIRYQNPFFSSFNNVRQFAKSLVESDEENELAKKLLSLDISQLSREVTFFYPFEVQIVDEEAHKINMEGEASHADYKKSQQRSAMYRLFKPLLEYKNIDVNLDS